MTKAGVLAVKNNVRGVGTWIFFSRSAEWLQDWGYKVLVGGYFFFLSELGADKNC